MPADTTVTAPKPFVFVMMPFKSEFQDVYDLGIKGACDDAGAYSERVDEQIIAGSMLGRIYNLIAKADILIADTTGLNPNVCYEVGYAHALNKHPVLITQSAGEIPFDLKHHQHLVYDRNSLARLRRDLAGRVRWMIENPSTDLRQADPGLQVYNAGRLLEPGSEIDLEVVSGGHYHVRDRFGALARCSLSLFNPGSLVTSRTVFVAIISELPPADRERDRATSHPDGKIMVNHRLAESGLFPQMWTHEEFHFFVLTSRRTTDTPLSEPDTRNELAGRSFNAELRIITEAGIRSTPVKLVART